MQPLEIGSIALALVVFALAAVVSGRRGDGIGWWIWSWAALAAAGLLLLLGESWTPTRAGGAFLAVAFPGLQLAGAFEYAERALPRWLIPAIIAAGVWRLAVAAAGFEMQSHMAVLVLELAALLAAARIILRSHSAASPSPMEWLIIFGFAIIGIAETLDAVLALRGPGVVWSVWLTIGVPIGACQILSTFDRLQGRLAASLEERERALRELEESNERFRTIAEEADDIIVEADDRHGIRYVNPRFHEALGYPTEEVLGRRIADFAWDREAFPSRADLVGHRRRPFGPLQVRHQDGTPRWMESSTRSYLRDGAQRLVVIARDVTERLRSDEAHRKNQKLESLGLVAGGIAHDFNNLLMGILGNAELALSELRPGDAARGFLRQLMESSEQAAQLTRQLQAYSGASPFEIRPLDVNDVIRSNADLLRTAVGEQVKLELALADDLPAVDGDPSLLLQVLLNLSLNGADACGDEPGSVRVATGMSRVGPSDPAPASGSLGVGDCVFVEVEDSGRGIDESIRDRLFDPFFTTNGTGRGRGLGLAVVHGVVKTLRAAMTVDSTPGSGSRFRLLLPPSSAAREQESASGSSGSLGPEGNETILVVDDEQAVLDVVRTALERYGYRVFTAASGEEARQIAASAGREIALVLLDAVMPGERSEEVLAELRSLQPGLPVVLISGFAEVEAMRHFAQSGGVSGFLAKPFRMEDLARRARDAIDRGR